MLKLNFNKESKSPLTILCLGAHSDDIEIGCGGTILRLLRENSNVIVHWVVLSSNELRAREARASAEAFLTGAAESHIEVKSFRDGFFPFEGADIKNYFEELKSRVSPDLVFTHFRNDKHQDHRLVCELTWNTFRHQLILEYEIPKWDGDLGQPNFYFNIPELDAQRKSDLLHEHFPSQSGKRWFSQDLFFALMRLRGMEVNAPENYAEGFYSNKAVM